MYKLNCLQKIGCKILKNGKIPSHIAFIMDGNRRYAKKLKKEATRGHFDGVQSLKKCLLICSQINVKMASFYCFSVENFNRSENQVKVLMDLCHQTFEQLSQVSQLLKSHEIKVNVIGNMELVRKDLVQMFHQLEERTKNFTKMTINLCFAYDSLHEIQQAIEKMNPSQMTYNSFMKNLLISEPVDVLVRTSNENRLSNFMLSQCGFSYLCILKENWPELGISSFLKIILEYNINHKKIEENKKKLFQKAEEEKIEDNEEENLLAAHQKQN